MIRNIFPHMYFNTEYIKPKKISDTNFYIFSIPLNCKILHLNIYLNTDEKIDCGSIIDWIYGDKIIFNPCEDMFGLSSRINFSDLKYMRDWNMINSFSKNSRINFYTQDKNVIKLNISFFSVCSEIRIKLINHNLVGTIHICVEKKVKENKFIKQKLGK